MKKKIKMEMRERKEKKMRGWEEGIRKGVRL